MFYYLLLYRILVIDRFNLDPPSRQDCLKAVKAEAEEQLEHNKLEEHAYTERAATEFNQYYELFVQWEKQQEEAYPPLEVIQLLQDEEEEKIIEDW